MNNLYDQLIELFKQDERLWAENQLLKNQVIELGLKLDPALLKLMLSHDRLKAHFFIDVDGVMVFDKEKFIRFVNNKAFLPDSYTSFKNKIGLTVNGHYLSESRDVVLAWPYKDCVLEGGQTKEDQKRDEVFWNEILAPDEIDRLLASKALTGFKRYDVDGEHEVTEIKDTDNLIIKGNNLLALHSLKKRFAGKVKLIYIDPPYNTGNDSFGYNDRFNHSSWLTYIKSRLEIAKYLLHETGNIFVQIDDFEVAYLKVMMDEIFGSENFRNKITWKRRGGSANPTTRLNNVVDYILWYSKNPSGFAFKPIFSLDDDNTQKYIEERFTNIDEMGRRFMKSPLQSPNPRPNLIYDYKGYKTPKNGYSISREVMEKWDREGKLWFPENKDQNINRKIYLDEYPGQPVSCLWTDLSVINPMSKERVDFDSGQKPEALIQRMLEMCTSPGDIVLDFFVGSGTTSAVAHKMSRQYIAVEQMDYIETITIERIKRVIGRKVKSDGKLFEELEYDNDGISKAIKWKGSGNFIYCELLPWNETFVKKIQTAPDAATLQTIWTDMQTKAFLSHRLDVAQFDANAEEYAGLSLDDQKRFLLEVLDKNQLYVNFSEIDDETYGVSDTDKRLNKLFYLG